MSFLRYMLAPEILPRLRPGRGPAPLARAVAALLVAGGVLPASAEVLRRPRYGVREVLAASFFYTPASLKHLDKCAFLLAVCLALVLFALQFTALVLSVVIPAAAAADAPAGGFMPDLLASVFGSPDLFGGSAVFASSPLHDGLYALLAFYSNLLMGVAAFIVLYLVAVTVGESAQSGTPFGKRFNGLYAPLRLVVALGLLVPLGAGLNAAQYLTLYAAKYGSEYATKGWRIFHDRVTGGLSTPAPSIPAVSGLMRAVFASEVCAAAFNVREAGGVVLFFDAGRGGFHPVGQRTAGDVMNAALDAGEDRAAIVWGRVWSPTGEGLALKDVCGRVSVKASRAPMAAAYLGEVLTTARVLRPWAEAVAAVHVPVIGSTMFGRQEVLSELPAALARAAQASQFRVMSSIMAEHSKAMSEEMGDTERLGWVAAGVYYPALAKSSRVFMALVREAFPAVAAPVSAEDFRQAKGTAHGFHQYDDVVAALAAAERYAGRARIAPAGAADAALIVDADALSFIDNPIESTLNFIFGTGRLAELRRTPEAEPLTALAAAGDALVSRSLITFAAGLGLDAAGSRLGNAFLEGLPVAGSFIRAGGKLLENVGAFAVAIASVGLLAGVVLLYVVPLLPFVYFFFALIGWLFAVAEALLCVPLWALAHLRIDGDGLPGPSAANGYALLLELFIRPILIVLAAVASYVLFWGASWALSSLFDLATADTGRILLDRGGEPSGLDSFVFTIIFAFVIYAAALGSFKLIDKIPNEALRWLGVGARPFMGGTDAPNLGGSMVAGGAAVAHVSGGLQRVAENLKRRGEGSAAVKSPAGPAAEESGKTL